MSERNRLNYSWQSERCQQQKLQRSKTSGDSWVFSNYSRTRWWLSHQCHIKRSRWRREQETQLSTNPDIKFNLWIKKKKKKCLKAAEMGSLHNFVCPWVAACACTFKTCGSPSPLAVGPGWWEQRLEQQTGSSSSPCAPPRHGSTWRAPWLWVLGAWLPVEAK